MIQQLGCLPVIMMFLLMLFYWMIKNRWINELIRIYETRKYCKNMRKISYHFGERMNFFSMTTNYKTLPKGYIKIKKKAKGKKS